MNNQTLINDSIDDKTGYVVGIGAANVDIYGKSNIPLRIHYDHPSFIKSSVGGVTRNILANYSCFSKNVKMITAVGDDIYGKMIINDLNNYGIDTSNVLVLENSSSNIFMQIQDENNDMHMALCDMTALQNITSSYLREKEEVLRNAQAIICDPSLSDEAIEELIKICKGKTPIYVDPISDNYALKIKKYVKDFTCMKPNKTELTNLSGVEINNIDDVKKAAEILIDQGLKEIYVSLGKEGLFYMNANKETIVRKLKSVENMANASGAGDALFSLIVYSAINNWDIDKRINYALAAGISAILSETTISSKMSLDYLEEIYYEYR